MAGNRGKGGAVIKAAESLEIIKVCQIVNMKILVIDNYDSFTYNLVQYIGELGAEVVTIRNDQCSVKEILSSPEL